MSKLHANCGSEMTRIFRDGVRITPFVPGNRPIAGGNQSPRCVPEGDAFVEGACRLDFCEYVAGSVQVRSALASPNDESLVALTSVDFV